MQHEAAVLRSLIPPLAALAFLSIGAGAAIAPEALAVNYGIPIEDDAGRAYVRGLGARDAVLGILIAQFLRSRNREALAATLGVSALVGASDFIAVLRARGVEAAGSLAIHAAGTIGLLVAAGLIATESAA
jgi:hypothetical protein